MWWAEFRIPGTANSVDSLLEFSNSANSGDIYNPNATSKQDLYLDNAGKPCAYGCKESHLIPGE